MTRAALLLLALSSPARAELDCDWAGQKASTRPYDEARVRTAVVEGLGRGTITARVLETSPLFLDVAGGAIPPARRGLRPAAVTEDDLPLIAGLAFGDAVEAVVHSGEEADAELVLSSVTRLAAERGGALDALLVDYRKPGARLALYRSGAVRYEEQATGRAPARALSEDELQDVLRVFGESRFSRHPALALDAAAPKGRVVLVCARAHAVGIAGRETALGRVLYTLDRIIDAATEDLPKYVSYQRRREVVVEDWPFSVSPAAHSQLLQSAGRGGAAGPAAGGNGPLDEEVPLGLQRDLASGRRVYLLHQGLLYAAAPRPCEDPCREDTLFALEIQPSAQPLWPAGAACPLASARTRERAPVDDADYLAHRAFYDALDGGAGVVENGVLYEGVSFTRGE